VRDGESDCVEEESGIANPGGRKLELEGEGLVVVVVVGVGGVSEI
jgi:hypothetical protein